METIKLSVEKELRHVGTCDASAAIAMDEAYFVVANDEDNILKVYHAEQSGEMIHGIEGRNLNDFFDNNPEQAEVDIEAAAKRGKITYWITSHGADSKGKKRKERHQFFGTTLKEKKGKTAFKQAGHAYTRLLKEMFKDKRLERFDLKAASKLPPKEKGGLNIEGLTVAPNKTLLIGFRNPIPDHKALILPLKNPKTLLKNPKQRAKFGKAILLDLDGLGIRSIEYWESQNRYIIIAGAYDGSDAFRLYEWSGIADETPILLEVSGMPEGFRPESVLFYPAFPDRLHLLSDDGTITRDNATPCKELAKENPDRHFRSLWLKVQRTKIDGS